MSDKGPQGRFSLKPQYPFYLAGEPGGEDRGGGDDDDAWIEVTDKYTLETATRAAKATADDVERAIDSAVRSQEELRAMPTHKRKEVLLHVARRLRERHDEMAYVLCVEGGKPWKDAVAEVDRGIVTCTAAAEEAVRSYGEAAALDNSELSEGFSCIVRRFPIGVCSFVSPFNYPLNLFLHKMAPAIAAGCPWVAKPASRTPVSALIVAELLRETDLPRASWSILPCSRDAAEALTVDDRIKLLSFTGSPDAGWKLKSKAGKKKVVLELGGNAPCIVDETADVEDAVDRVVTGAFHQAGQSCISVQRLYVHESVYDEFRDRFVGRVSELKSGDPKDPDNFVGPLISTKDADRLDEWTKEAVGRGARVLVGGKRGDKAFFEATVVEDVPEGCKLRDDEAFGPVVTLSKFSDFKEAVRLANDSRFGLQAGVFTNNFTHAFYAYETIVAGGVVINDVPTKRVDTMPYGGVRDSGLGREGLRYAIEDMTEQKVMLMRNAARL